MRRLLTAVLVGGVGLIAGIFLGANPSWMPDPVRSVLIEPIAGQGTSVNEEATDLIESRYFREPDLERLDDASITGMVRELRKRYRDRFTHYFDPEQSEAFNEALSGTFSGVGMTVGSLDDEGLSVGLVFRGSPADRAGLEPGDVIVSVDGVNIDGEPLDSVVSRIKGPEGSEVELGIRIQGRGQKKTFTLRREEIRRIVSTVERKGYTLIPLSIHVSPKGKLKVRVALSEGKSHGDKREALQEREAKRELDRARKGEL